VAVGSVQAGARKALDQPLEQRGVPGVHAQRDLRLAPVAAERTLADEDPHQYAPVIVAEIGHRDVRVSP